MYSYVLTCIVCIWFVLVCIMCSGMYQYHDVSSGYVSILMYLQYWHIFVRSVYLHVSVCIFRICQYEYVQSVLVTMCMYVYVQCVFACIRMYLQYVSVSQCMYHRYWLLCISLVLCFITSDATMVSKKMGGHLAVPYPNWQHCQYWQWSVLVCISLYYKWIWMYAYVLVCIVCISMYLFWKIIK